MESFHLQDLGWNLFPTSKSMAFQGRKLAMYCQRYQMSLIFFSFFVKAEHSNESHSHFKASSTVRDFSDSHSSSLFRAKNRTHSKQVETRNMSWDDVRIYKYKERQNDIIAKKEVSSARTANA
jgi:hypothetical protein